MRNVKSISDFKNRCAKKHLLAIVGASVRGQVAARLVVLDRVAHAAVDAVLGVGLFAAALARVGDGAAFLLDGEDGVADGGHGGNRSEGLKGRRQRQKIL